MSRDFEVDDIFTRMRIVTGLKTCPRTGFFMITLTYCNISFPCGILKKTETGFRSEVPEHPAPDF